MLTSRAARDAYKFEENFYRPDGRIILDDFSAARRFAAQFSARRADPVPASDIYAMFLLDEALRILLKNYQNRHGGIMQRAMGLLQSVLGTRFEKTLLKFTEEFPPTNVYRGLSSAGEYLSLTVIKKEMRGVRTAVIEEMMLLNIANGNEALQSYKTLFDDSILRNTAYKDMLDMLGEFFAKHSAIGNVVADNEETLYEILFAPFKAAPNSLEGQLQYIVKRWGHILGEEFTRKLLRGMDFIREDIVRRKGHGDTKEEISIPTYIDQPSGEAYSPDKDWMPRLVLIAKNAYIWLGQLSRRYQREITRLDQIPDEELDILSQWGFTGLWLIGLWERSRASEKIKRRMGQEDAAASAYSLYSYDVAEDLGGWDALHNLRQRAWDRGIRLSADMVPNHTGIDSKWVIEHPNWFLSMPHSPYPAYSFRSENLSDDLRVGIYIEDHYYNKSDAAVVFQRRDLQTGDLRYIYHGNDGTSYPWNDTAQLDYTNAEAREAVIQTILHVARNFQIIRFDAAMTLAKKHVQRLWFPEPGTGGAIPSRAERGITKSEFDALVPNEFWREVVDRVAAEVPDTLLLAEAFWLLEGYFVRTLGMHRVYNSAFMHMLRDEDNAKYRQAIKNTLEFDPRILQRYVNFLSNPDEKTAIEQFGKDDKYFGACVLLATLPGLPMFGHGQIEGFTEKYGMEYRRAKWEENPDDGFIRHHEAIIFPLLHRRRLFAGVENFLFYDFVTTRETVDENVFAYTNGHNAERALVIHHNKFSDTRGWIKTSVPFHAKGRMRHRSLAEGLGLTNNENDFVTFRDLVTNREYMRSIQELIEKGLYVELGAYKCHAFVDFRVVSGDEWKSLNDYLAGAGVNSLKQKMRELFGARSAAKAEKKETVEPVIEKKETGKKTKKELTEQSAQEEQVKAEEQTEVELAAPVEEVEQETEPFIAPVVEEKPIVEVVEKKIKKRVAPKTKPAKEKSAKKIKKKVAPVKVKKIQPAKTGKSVVKKTTRKAPVVKAPAKKKPVVAKKTSPKPAPKKIAKKTITGKKNQKASKKR